MTRAVTIVMYHYVRDLAASAYPEIKGLTVERFVGQLDYLQRHYSLIDAETLLAALSDARRPLPRNAALLTFDDGYRDHFETVFPILEARGLRGLFFPPVQAVAEHRVLDVNKVHFVLASVPDKRALVAALDAEIERARETHALDEMAEYHARWERESRWDPPEVVYVKAMLQRGLPAAVRARIAGALFRRFVTEDEAAFARTLYMSVDELAALRAAGMYVGHHGYSHCWIDGCGDAEQAREVDEALDFLAAAGAPTDRWIMCYPYGAWDERLLKLLRARRCAAGLTTRVDIADLDADPPLLLPRLDTNDLPQNADAAPNA